MKAFWKKDELPVVMQDLDTIAEKNKEVDMSEYNGMYIRITVVSFVLFFTPFFIDLGNELYNTLFFIGCYLGGGAFILISSFYLKQKKLEESQGKITVRFIVKSPDKFYHIKLRNSDYREIEPIDKVKNLRVYLIENSNSKMIVALPDIKDPFKGQIEKHIMGMFEIPQQTVTITGELVGFTEIKDTKVPIIEAVSSEAILREHLTGGFIVDDEKIEKVTSIYAGYENKRTRGYQIEKLTKDWLDYVASSKKSLIDFEAKSAAKYNMYVRTQKDLISFGNDITTKDLIIIAISFLVGMFVQSIFHIF